LLLLSLSFFPGLDGVGQPAASHLPGSGMGADTVVQIQVGVVLAATAGEKADPAGVCGFTHTFAMLWKHSFAGKGNCRG
jgi:hypothetical protein